MTIETPTQETQTAQVTADPGSEDAAALAFASKDTVEETETKDEAEPADETEAEADPEPEEGDTEEADDKDKPVEVEYEGKTYKVAPELQKALLRQSDYSRKMNEVGAKEKSLTQTIEQAEKLVEGAEKYAEALAEVNGIDAQLKQFEKVEWQKLRAENPAEYAALAADMQSLRLSRDDATRKAQGLDAEMSKARQKVLADKQADMHKALSKSLKGWGDELGTKITKYAMENGYAVEELKTTTDPRWVILADKARKYDALQAQKATIKAKAQDAPQVTKPGAPRVSDKKAEALAKLRKDGSLDSAAAAFYR